MSNLGVRYHHPYDQGYAAYKMSRSKSPPRYYSESERQEWMKGYETARDQSSHREQQIVKAVWNLRRMMAKSHTVFMFINEVKQTIHLRKSSHPSIEKMINSHTLVGCYAPPITHKEILDDISEVF